MPEEVFTDPLLGRGRRKRRRGVIREIIGFLSGAGVAEVMPGAAVLGEGGSVREYVADTVAWLRTRPKAREYLPMPKGSESERAGRPVIF